MKTVIVKLFALILVIASVAPFALSCAKNEPADGGTTNQVTTTATTTAATTSAGPDQSPIDPALANDPYASAGYELILKTISKCYNTKNHWMSTATDSPDPPAVWGVASFIEAVAEAYRLFPDNETIGTAYRDMLTVYLDTYKVKNATINAPSQKYTGITYYNATKGGKNDYYYDDNAWICIQLLIGYKQLGDESLLEAAEKNLEFLWTGWDDVLDGGIYWDKSFSGKNTCANGPVAIAMLLAYQLTGKEEYLERGRMIYDWMRAALLDGNLYIDAINAKTLEKNNWKAAYNQATPIYAGALLYEITGDETYYDQTKATVNASINLMFKISGTKPNQTVQMNGNPIFKAWCVGWLARGYVKFYEVDPKKDTTAMYYLEKVLDNELSTRNFDGNVYYDPYFLTGDWGGESKTDILQPTGVASTFLLAGYYDVVLTQTEPAE